LTSSEIRGRKGHGRFKPQRVARAQAAGPMPNSFAGFEHLVPARSLVGHRTDIDLEAVFAGVAGPRDQRVVEAANLAQVTNNS